MAHHRSQEETAQFHAFLAHEHLDSALGAFVALEEASDVFAADDDFGTLLRSFALELLDDVTTLASIVAAAPRWPRVPAPPSAAGQDADDVVSIAVAVLARYADRLAGTTVVLARDPSAARSQAAVVFARLADAAADRLTRLAG